ncbi:MAG TPA: PAS-domain containing protein, partial [Luteimonas sp.]|nr:PAS-domain containing protein [Luteimonas sp.]
IAATRQYPPARLRAARIESLDAQVGGARRVRIDDPPTAGTWLLRSRHLPAQDWTLHALRDTRAAGLAARTAFAATLAAWLPLVLLVMFLRQRARLARHQQRSREELERMVAHHAQALRSAQDDLVLAAHAAARGQLESLEHLPQGVSVVDAQLRLVAWNSRYSEIFQYPPELLQVGRPIEDLLRHNARRGWLGRGDTHDAVQRRLDYLRSGGAYQQERERPDGTVLEIRGNPLPGGGFVTSYTDITSYTAAARELRTLATTLQRRVEDSTRDLREAKLEAERANRYKGRFVAAAVHDLLQPLNAARMLAGALHDRLRGASDRELVDRIAAALDAQDELLSDLLELSRLETGALQPNLADVPLSPLLDDLAGQFAVLARPRGLSLRRVDTRAVVRSDPVLLRRMLQNLLSNALQYTGSGGVLLGCRRDGDHLRIEVLDTGVGIPADKHAAIFEEFRRLDNGVERDRRNAGLGLSIVDRIARLLGHRLELRSQPGRGSVFSLRVPRVAAAAPPPATAAAPASDSPLRGSRIWVVDDDRDGALAMHTLLQGWGCEVTMAHDAAALLALCHAQPPPDLLLLDYQLGDAVGPDLLPACRQHWGRLPPVVVVSALRDEALRGQVAAIGLRLLTKPVAPAALRALLSQLLLAARGAR